VVLCRPNVATEVNLVFQRLGRGHVPPGPPPIHQCYLLYLFVLADDLLAGDWIMLDAVISSVHNELAERTETAVTTDSKQRSVKERMILTEIIFTLRPKHINHVIRLLTLPTTLCFTPRLSVAGLSEGLFVCMTK